MNDGIFDFRFAICDLATATRRKSGRDHDCGQFARFLSKRIHFAFGQKTAVDNQFHPISRLVSFFLHGSEPGNELGFRASPTSRAVICANRRSASDELISQSTTFCSPGKSRHKLEHTQSELLCSVFQFGFVHGGIFDFRFAICDLKKRSGKSASQSQINDWNRRKDGQVARLPLNRKSQI
jgi:hypothetical protein